MVQLSLATQTLRGVSMQVQTLRGVQSSVFIVRLYITSKKRKVETPSDSDSDPATPEGGSFPATPEGGSFPLLSQLDGADLDIQSPIPPTPVPVPPDCKKSQDCKLWSRCKPCGVYSLVSLL